MPLQFQILICHKYLLNRKGIKASIIFHYQLFPSVRVSDEILVSLRFAK